MPSPYTVTKVVPASVAAGPAASSEESKTSAGQPAGAAGAALQAGSAASSASRTAEVSPALMSSAAAAFSAAILNGLQTASADQTLLTAQFARTMNSVWLALRKAGFDALAAHARLLLHLTENTLLERLTKLDEA